jgi:hypothetical protein
MSANRRQKKLNRVRSARRGRPGGGRLHSIAAWPEQRTFTGNFSLGGAEYKFTYAPSRAAAINNLLELAGRLTVTDAPGRAHALNSVRATLANTQGGIGAGPIRRQIIATQTPTGAQTTSQQKQKIAGETEKQAGEKQSGQAQTEKRALPVTENTGPTSYCGVLYFHFEPLDARALGVPADLSKVQLNVRLSPLDDTAKLLHGLYCYVAEALYSERADEKLAAAAITELNRIFGG